MISMKLTWRKVLLAKTQHENPCKNHSGSNERKGINEEKRIQFPSLKMVIIARKSS